MRLVPLLALGMLHALAGGMCVVQSEQRLAGEVRRAAAAGEWRQAYAQIMDALRRSMAPPPPPPPPAGGGAMDEATLERRSCDALKVRVGAAWADVKAAYRKLALEHHPDKLQGKLERTPTQDEQAAAAARFREIQEAHDALEGMYEHRGLKQ